MKNYEIKCSIFSVFKSIWVSTNDLSVIKWVNSTFKDAVRIHERAEYTATDTASSLLAVQEFLNSYSGKEVFLDTNIHSNH